MRIFWMFLLLLFLFPAASYPCSCVLPPYESLCSTLATARDRGANGVVVRVTALSDREARLQIERELFGEAPFGTFTFRRGNGADCGILLTEARVGSRYLAFFDLAEGQDTYTAVECGYRYNMFPIVNGAVEYNNDIELVQSGEGPPQLYFDLNRLLTTGACTPFLPAGALAERLRLWPNPTAGSVQLDTLQAIPSIYALELYDIAGKRIGDWAGPITFPYTLELSTLPAGVYLLRVWADRQHQVFRIVRS